MHLLSATVRNYRIHREQIVEFDRALTVISGPNESGKSTLIEAIHRGLFLRSKTTGEMQKQMIPLTHSGHPEVDVSFHAAEKTWHLVKRFSGQSGTTLLKESEGKTFHGEEAESCLSGLLRAEDIGRATATRLAQQWAHLWVWQGKSGENPCRHTGAEHDTLLRRLQQTGGAAVMQSECDSRVAAYFSDLTSKIFSQRDKPKKGSDLERAESALIEAEAKQADAAGRIERLSRAVADFEQALATMERLASDLKELAEEHSQVTAKLSRAEKLSGLEKLQKSDAGSSAEQYHSLKQADTQISELRGSITGLEKQFTPGKGELEKLERQCADLRERAVKNEEAYNKAGEATREARLRRDFAVAVIRLFETKSRQDELTEKGRNISARKQKVSDLREQLARLPEIDDRRLKKLQALESGLGNAEAALHAMAAGIEVVAADGPVRVGETALAAGDSKTVTETTEVAFGDVLRLRINPGGGDSLVAARRKVSEARETLRRELDAIGLSDTQAAAEAVNQRNDLQQKIKREEALLEGMDADKVAAQLAKGQEDHAAAKAEVDRRKEQVPDTEIPADLEAAGNLFTALEQQLRDAEIAEKDARANRDAAQKHLAKLEDKRKKLENTVTKHLAELNGFKAQLQLLLKNHGDDETRARTLREAQARKETKESVLNETRRALAELQPDQMERDRIRLERAQKTATEQQQEARERRAEAQALLRSDGSEDPEADLALAEARLESARQHLGSVRRKAEAIRLLDELFTEEQRALAESFSQPLAEKISGYLQCVFGPETRARMTLGENAFTALEIVRGGNGLGAIPFDSLSGGTREQVAAAFRLAMAEVLAEDNDGCLPIVFDDAFAYSDAGRVKTLQRMLDLAADRGLQVIVLTCNPSDYAGLGARQVSMSVPSPGIGSVASASV